MSVRAIFLDLGGVVIGLNWTHTFEFLGIKDPARQKEMIAYLRDSKTLDSFERGLLSRAEFFGQLVKDWQLMQDLRTLEAAWSMVNLGPLPGVERIFDLYEKKAALYALSNTNESHIEHIVREYPVTGRFRKIFTSHELGHRKPEPEMYLKAAMLASVKPEESIFIDDLAANVEAARKLGFHAYQTVNSTDDTLAKIALHF